MTIVLNLILIGVLAGLLLRARKPQGSARWRRNVAAVLLVMVLIPLGVWQAVLYIDAKKHAFAQDYTNSFVEVARAHLPYVAYHLAVEVVFVALAAGVGGLLGEAILRRGR